MKHKEKSSEELSGILEEIQSRYIDNVDRRVSDSSDVQADGNYWAVVNDHGNAEICHRGRNGVLYYDGGLV